MGSKLFSTLFFFFSATAFATGNTVQTFKDPVAFGYSTAGKACYLDVNKELQASLTTSTELGYLSGVTSGVQAQIDGKQGSGSYITALTSDVTASGPGSAAATVASVGGSSAANVHSAELAANAATAANTASTILKRDGSGQVAATTFTGALAGNATTASGLSATLAAGSGGTGQTSIAAAFVSFYESVATTLGDLIYGAAGGTPTRLTGNTSNTMKFLSEQASSGVAQAPAWTQPACSNLSNAAASCSTDATNASNISSGTLGLARGGTNADLSATGGASQILFQTSSGGAITVARPSCSTLSNAATSCSTDATNASNISSGTLGAARGGTGIDTSASTGMPSIASGTWSISSLATTFVNLFETVSNSAGALLYGGAGGTPTILSAGSANQILRMNTAGTAPRWTDTVDQSDQIIIFSDFISGNMAVTNSILDTFWGQCGGTGAAFADNSAAFTYANPGVVNGTTGTTTTGFCYIGLIGPAKNVFFGNDTFSENLQDVSALSDGTNTYLYTYGFFDTPPSSASSATTGVSNGAYFYYSNGVNSGNWDYVTCNGGTCTTNTTSTAPVTSGFQKLSITYTAATPSVTFAIGGVTQGSAVTSNLPATTTALRFFHGMTKTAGTAARSFNVDYLKVKINLGSAR